MVKYRRTFLPGGTFFFTVTLRNRRAKYLTEHIDTLRQAMRTTQIKKPYHINAVVILPDHLHTIWTLPQNDNDYSTRWRDIKTIFTKELLKKGCRFPKDNRHRHALWQSRFWEHTIKNQEDLEHHINYIHYNPVKHGLVDSVLHWPYSSFHKYLHQGTLPKNWATAAHINNDMKSYGE